MRSAGEARARRGAGESCDGHTRAPVFPRRSKERTKGDSGDSPQETELRTLDTTVDTTHAFPRGTPIVVFLCTLAVRLYYVSQPRNWWILHPDETFQALEVAHSEVYGYGFRSYEYLPPPNGGQLSPAEEEESRAEMYSTRSFLVPRMFMLLFHLYEASGIESHPYVVAKLFHGAVCSFLPLAVYRFTEVLYRSHDIACMACILSASSVHLSVFGTHTLLNSFLTPALIYLVSYAIEMLLYGSYDKDESRPVNPVTSAKPDITFNRAADIEPSIRDRTVFALACALLGLVCYAQPEKLIFLFVLFLPLTLAVEDKCLVYKLNLVIGAEGFLVGIVLGGMEDLFSYGEIFCSFRQWIRFRLHLFYSRLIVHPNPTTYYWSNLFLQNPSTVVALMATVVLHFRYAWSGYRRRHAGNRFAADVCLTITFVVLFTYDCFRASKELRFLHDLVVIMLVIEARAVHAVFIDAPLQYMGSLKTIFKKALPWVLTCLFITFSYISFPSHSDGSATQWMFPREWDSAHINRCLKFVSHQRDVTGVYLSRRFDVTGGYTLLHRDVPVLSRMSRDFGEFSKQSRKKLPSIDPFSGHAEVSLAVLSGLSDYIDDKNHAYLYKAILHKDEYNYLIVGAGDTFLATGFKAVFRSGTMEVFKRLTDEKTLMSMRKIASTLPIGTEADVLYKEAQWLMRVGVVDKAVERLKKALDIDPSKPEIYQLLAVAHVKNKDIKSAFSIQELCKEMHGFQNCVQAKSRLVISKTSQGEGHVSGDVIDES